MTEARDINADAKWQAYTYGSANDEASNDDTNTDDLVGYLNVQDDDDDK